MATAIPECGVLKDATAESYVWAWRRVRAPHARESGAHIHNVLLAGRVSEQVIHAAHPCAHKSLPGNTEAGGNMFRPGTPLDA